MLSADRAWAADDLGLSQYQVPPDVEVSVREFEDFTRDRLKVLHAFDRQASYDTKLEAIPDLMNGKVKKDLIDANMLLQYPSGTNADTFPKRKEEFRTKDAISHFALRLAFCKTRDARDWFLKQEQRLFVLRFDSLKPEAKEAFMAASGVKCKKIDMTARQGDGKVNLHEVLHSTPGAKIYIPGKAPEVDPNFYEMPFAEVSPNLIAQRKVVVQRGVAYVPSSALKLILAKRFRDQLSASLDVAFQGLPMALSDPRIGGFLRDLQEYGMQLLVAPKSNSDELAENLTLENFEEMFQRSFPPCMRRLVEQQRERKKHLKHAGRLQLRPFLKECGFNIEDSFRWWKQELCRDPEIDAASYEKSYTYDVEHTYGKKGHLQGQNTFGCPKIIGFPGESAGQVHGCPFKSQDIPALKQQLHRWRVPEEAVGEIDRLIGQGKHYQLACIEYFKAKHPGHTGDGVGNSPNDYFRESCSHHCKEKEKQAAATSPAKA